MIKCFTDTAWEDYSFWFSQDKKIVKRIHQLLKDIDSTPYSGIGKPELLNMNCQANGAGALIVNTGSYILAAIIK